jgi:glycosyltransferase involved in cell wall biosynthesis
MQYRITIGMPVYNVEDYIKQSLTCALNQDLNLVEILIVDDCGTDSSMVIVKELQKEHPNGKNIKIIKHPQNLGVAEARNTIIREAQGKYIFFQDSDDLIDKDSLSSLYQAAEKHQAELTYGSTNIREDNNERPYITLPDKLLIGKDALANYIYNDIHENIPNSIWNILIRTDFLRNNGFTCPDFKIGEDLLLNEQMQPEVSRAVLLSKVTYHYLKRPNSLMQFQCRETIDKTEAEYSLYYSKVLKQYCLSLKHKKYFDRKCAKTMKGIFYSACGILKHRHQFTGNICDKDIRDSMIHPAHLIEILSFKHKRIINLIFWTIGILPPKISVSLIKYIGKRKGYI